LYKLRVPNLILLAITVAFGTRAFLRADTVDDYVRAQMTWEKIPGLSIAVVLDGKVIKTEGYGLANLETNTVASPESVYRIGSVSKQFLAAGVMLLVQEGKVGLDDPIRKYLDDTPATWKDITVRQLLSHTSGIPRESPGFDPMKVQSDSDVIKATYSLPLQFTPGSKWGYSNINYYCVAEIIRKVTSEFWGKFITERIFKPTDMTSTRTATVSEIVPNRASGYTTEDGLRNADVWIALRPSGAFVSTVSDFVKWDAALYTDEILNAESRRAMWTPVKLNDGSSYPYGFGWFVDAVNGHQRIHHGGGVPGFVAEFDRFPDSRISVVILANIQNRDLSDLAVKVAGYYKAALKPSLAPPIPDRSPEITDRIRSILAGLASGSLDKGQFAPKLASQLSMQMSSGGFMPLERLGPIESLELLESKKNGDITLYSYRVSFKGIALSADCSLSDKGQVLTFALSD
jgi:CubicO group peptidase (beta-lactamase class C family)